MSVNTLLLRVFAANCLTASRLMSENTSLFSHADFQIQLHTPASAIPQDLSAPALHDSAPDHRTKPAKKTSRSPKKAKTATT